MAGVEAPLMVAWVLRRGKGEGEGEEGQGGGLGEGVARGAPMEGRAWGEAPWGCSFVASVSRGCSVLA
jgi:hypothetical protein